MMKYVLDSLILDLGAPESSLKPAIAKRLGLAEKSFRYDVLDRDLIISGTKRCVEYKVSIETVDFIRDTSIHFLADVASFEIPAYRHKDRPVVVGAGLAGLYATYVLALAGANPILLEQGKDYAKRTRDFEAFQTRGILDGLGNGRFGLGGFLGASGCRISKDSDDIVVRWFLSTLQSFGIPLGKDHNLFLSAKTIGALSMALVKAIKAKGGEVIFEAVFLGQRSFLGKIKEARYRKGNREFGIPTSHLLLCAGESNPQLMRLCGKSDAAPYLSSIGFMLEKPGSELSRGVYGVPFPDAKFPTSFRVLDANPSSDIKGEISYFYPSTSPIFMGIKPEHMDLGLSILSPGASSGITMVSLRFKNGVAAMRECNNLAAAGYKQSLPYACPIETLKDYLLGKEPLRLGVIKPSYGKGVYLADLNKIYGGKIGAALKKTLEALCKKEPSFADGRSLLLGPCLTLGNGEIYDTEEKGKTNVRGLFFAAPESNWDYSLNRTAIGGIAAALTLIRTK